MHQGRGRGVVRRGSAVLAVGTLALAMGAYRGNDRLTESAGGEVGPSWSSDGAPAAGGALASEISSALQRRLDAAPAGVRADRWARVQRLYGEAGSAPLWLAPDGLDDARGEALVRALADATDDGLRLDAYPIDALVAALQAVRETRRPTAEQLADADVLLTATWVSLATDLLAGQVEPKGLSQEWHIRRDVDAVDSVVAAGVRAARPDSVLAALRPVDPSYDVLRRELARFREIVAAGGWPTVPAGRKLRPGQSDAPERLAALRERLRVEGFGADAPADSLARPGVYDRALAGRVAEWQARHGIVVDSVLGEGTVKALNVPATYRLGQLAANLERWRWLPRTLGDRYLLVNLPAFRLTAVEGGRPALEMKVIVGKTEDGTRTPVFSDSMETVVFRPYWNVTPDIQAEEVGPRAAADPGYLAANDMEYYRDGGETRIRQRPGEKNSLGLVKFLFPNEFNVYLHDTPNDELFEKDVRAFSHGCIRLEQPDALAEWALGWDAAKVYEAMHDGTDDRAVRLPRKIPVYIVYTTAYARDGVLHFGNDLYDRDAALVAALSAEAAPGAEALRQVDALRRLVAE
jgi:L,D-transpeptidase YcbB